MSGSAVETWAGEALGETAEALVRFLEGHAAVAGVELAERAGADAGVVESWEAGAARRGWLGPSGTLPRDVRQALMVSDGLRLTWDASVDGGATVHKGFGCIRYNALAELVPLDVHAGWPADDIPRGAGADASVGLPEGGHGCTTLCIDSHCPAGNVALVSGPGGESMGVWLQDLEGRWHALADSFSDYMRLQVVHLGLPSWQLAFTDTGLTTDTEIWLRFMSPERLQLNNMASHRKEKGEGEQSASALVRSRLDLDSLETVAEEVRIRCQEMLSTPGPTGGDPGVPGKSKSNSRAAAVPKTKRSSRPLSAKE